MDKLGWVCAVYLAFLGLGIIWNFIGPFVSQRWTAWRRGDGLDFPPIEAPRLVVTLVHGTWGMTSEWTRPGSDFVKALEGALAKGGATAVQFRRFRWSGGNSFTARKRAQEELAKHIRQVAEEHRDVPHYMVSHSHGGNVALAALRALLEYDLRIVTAADGLVNEGRNLVIVALVGTELHIRVFDVSGKKVVDKAENELVSGKTLTALKKQLTPIPDESGLSKEDKQKIIGDATSIAGYTRDVPVQGVACLGTPFLIHAGRDEPPLAQLVALAYGPFIAILLLALLWMPRDVDGMLPPEFLTNGVAGAVIGLTVWYLAGVFAKHVKPTLLPPERLANTLADRLLIIRSRGDEAAAGLGFSYIAGWAVRWLWQRVYRPFHQTSQKYDLRMMSVTPADGLVNDGRNVVIVALVGTDLHIRIFDVSGKKVVDKAENELVSGKTLTDLKKQLTPITDESGLSKEDKQKIIGDATSIAGHIPSQRPRAVYAQRVAATIIAVIAFIPVIALPIPFVTGYQEWLIAILPGLLVAIVVSGSLLWFWIFGRPVVGPGLEMMFYVPLNLLLGVFAMPFAPELILFSAYLDISAEPTPVGKYVVLELAGGTSDLSLGGSGGQSHSTYDDKECPPAIARWICKSHPASWSTEDNQHEGDRRRDVLTVPPL